MKLPLMFNLLLVLGFRAIAQKCSIEMMLKENAISNQTMLSKRFSDSSKFGVFSLINFTLPFNKLDSISKNYSIELNGLYTASKHFVLLAGVFTNKKDYGASFGLLTRFGFKNGQFILINRNAILTNYSSEFLTMTEYRPKISKKLNLYTRLQTIIETDFKSIKKNGQLLRVGIAYKYIQMGLGASFNVFGEVIQKNSYGVFFRTEV